MPNWFSIGLLFWGGKDKKEDKRLKEFLYIYFGQLWKGKFLEILEK